MWRRLRIAGTVVLALVGLLLALVAGGLGYGRSARGRVAMAEFARTKLSAVFPGGFGIGRIEGDLTGTLVLHDVVIYDLEGQPAIRADRLEAHYRLPALLGRNLVFRSLDVRGLLVVSRPLADGRDNLGSMAHSEPGPASTSMPIAIDAERVGLEGRFVRLPAGTPLDRAPADTDFRFAGTGSASLARAMSLRIGWLSLDVAQPVRGHLDLQGTLDFRDEVALRHAVARVHGDLSELRRRVPRVKLHGSAHVEATAEGRFKDLQVSLNLHLLSHELRLAANGRIDGSALTVERFALRGPSAQLTGGGAWRYGRGFEVEGRGTLSDLRMLADFGAPPLAGSVRLDGKLGSDAGALRVRLHATGEQVHFGQLHLATAAIDASTVDLVGKVTASATGLRAGDFALQRLRVDAQGTSSGIAVDLRAEAREKTLLHLQAAGRAEVAHARVHGFKAELSTFRLAVGGRQWREQRPASLSADFSRDRFRLTRLELSSGPQRLALEGSISNGVIEHARVEGAHLDLSAFSPLTQPRQALPRTDISLLASARGPFSDPTVDVKLNGEAHGRSERDQIHLAGSAEAHLAQHRLTGRARVTIGGQVVRARVDMPLPLRPHAPIAIEVDASVLLNPALGDFLTPRVTQAQPPFMSRISGLLKAELRVAGTTSAPVLRMKGNLPSWEAAGKHGSLRFGGGYKNGQLMGDATMELSSLPAGGGSGGGTLSATASLPLDLARLLSGQAGAVPADWPLRARLDLRQVAVDQLPFGVFNVRQPLRHGHLDGRVELAGTLATPEGTVEVVASDFGIPGTGFSTVVAKLSGRLDRRTLAGNVQIALPGSPPARIEGRVHLAAGGVRRTDFTRAALRVDAAVPGFDLTSPGLVEGMAGTLRGSARLDGTVAGLTAKGDFEIAGLRLGRTRFSSFTLSGGIANRTLKLTLLATQSAQETLKLEASYPLAGGAIDARLVAHGFLLDIRGQKLPGLRSAGGLIDADLRISGTRQHPVVRGHATVKGGALRIVTAAIDYRDLDAALAIDEHELRIEYLRLKSGRRGEAELQGHAALSALKPTSLEAKLTLRKFPVQQQGVSVLVDAEIEASGKKQAGGGLAGSIRVRRGSAQLPDFDRTRLLHPTGDLEDVQVVESIEAERKRERAPATGLKIGALLDGPFVLHGKEVHAVAQGGVSIDLTGPRPALSGTLRMQAGGWIDLFGRRYDLERGRISFEGGSEARLDCRISRRTASATIGVDVSGTTSDPQLVFWSDPPVYDRTQVVGIILSGDPGRTRVSTAGLERQAIGALSNLVVTSIKRNLLRELPIDVVRLDVNKTSGSSVQRSQVEVGKFLTDALYVGYAYQVGVDRIGTRRQNRNEGVVDYRVARDWQVEATFGDAGVGGLDLYWSYRP